MSLYYTTKEGDILDELVYRIYGKTSGYFEKVLFSNPGLSRLPDILPSGITIFFPDLNITKKDDVISLWD